MSTFIRILSITCRECLRTPASTAVVSIQLFILGFLPHMPLFAFRDKSRVIGENALATTFFLTLITGILFAHHCIRRDITRGTIAQVAATPISRSRYASAKICGVLLACFSVSLCGILATIHNLRATTESNHNAYLSWFYFGSVALIALINAWRNFSQEANFNEGFCLSTIFAGLTSCALFQLAPSLEAQNLPGSIVALLFLASLATLIMTAFSCLVAFYFPLTLNFSACCLFFFCGTALGSIGSSSAIATFLPDWQKFWLTGILNNNASIPTEYLFWSGVYCISITATIIVIAAMLFETREVASSS